MAKSPAPVRPDNIPTTAVWDPEDEAFRDGPTDGEGRRHGRWPAWYASGRAYGEEGYAAGVLHGASWCARGEGAETPFDETVDARVVRMERVYERGMLMRERCFTAEGAAVGSDGEPWPERVGEVPDTASYVARSEMWVDGPIDAAGPISGRQRLWYREGQLLQDAEFRDGKKHGVARVYDHGDIKVDVGISGPPLTRMIEAEYVDDRLARVAFFERDHGAGSDTAMIAKPLATAQLVDGKLHGTLTWNVARQINHSSPVMVIGERVVSGSELRGEDKVRGTKAYEVELANDQVVSRRWFDEHGVELFPPAPVADFGQDTTAVTGYLVDGGFARDVAAWFGGREASSLDEDAERAAEAFAQLAAPQPALALDAFVKAGKMPWLETVGLHAYGFDAVKNDLYGAAEARYFGLAYDAMGNMQFLDLETGSVLGYEHEEGIFDERRAFADLDSWAFAMLRVQLVAERRTPKAEVRALLERLGLAAGVFELDAVSR